MKHLLTCIVALAAALHAAPAAAKPNILHIHADDHRPDGLRALGNPLLQTPNLDSLVERGMTFTHCYTMGSMIGAVCTPSRTMMLTGRSWQRIPGAPGAAPNAANPATFLPRVIEAAGYQTWHMGKAGNGFGAGLKEFDTSIIDDAKGSTPETDRAHCSQRLADRTIEFLKSRAASHETRPFYIYLAPPVPHDPRSAEPQFHKLYDPANIPLSPAFMPQHPFDNGEMSVRDEMLAPWPRTPADTKQQNADYYSCITGLDHHIGRILAELKASGQWDNTIIIFSGDNGLSLGEHGLFGKQNLYEFGGMHVPLVVAGPGIPKGRSEAFVYLMDLFPTFAEFAGAKVPAGVEGQSIVPLLSGKQTRVRDVLYTGYRDCQRAIRDERWKLIRYPLVDRTQLFDLSADPHELVSLADKPEHAAKVAELTALLTKEMASHADKVPLTVANPKPAEWTPPAAARKPAKAARKKPAAAAVGQPSGRLTAAAPATPKNTAGLGDEAPAGKPYTYKKSAGKPRQMEIYFPPNHDPSKAKVPGVILFHGGGWGAGTLSQFRLACAYFASRGLVCATAEYQMLSGPATKKLPAGESRKRVCVTDAKSAIRWFKQHASELGIDPKRIITGGGSAGGHISALATLNPGLNDPADPKDIDTSVVAYLWFNPAFAPDDDKDAEIDVLRYVKPGLAPAIVFFGDQDTWTKGWDVAQAKWQALGNQTLALQIAPGQSHSFFNKEPWQTLTLIAADRFLVKLGLLTGEPTKTAPASGDKLIPAEGK